jgi:hypothetical protein
MAKWAAGGAVVAAILAAILLIGGDDSPGVPLAEAAERIEGQSMRQRVDMTYGDSTGRYEMSGEGVVTADSSRMSFDMKVSMEGERGARRFLMRNLGEDYWFRVPALDEVMPEGRRWIHAVDNATPATLLTPAEFVEFLTEADEVSEAGEKRLLGKDTTKYQGVIDLEELADEIGGDAQERLQRALEQENFPDNRRPGIGIDAYIAEDGLPVRLVMWGGETDDNSLYMTTDILEYGVPVEVEAPPPAKTIEEAEFNRLTGG